jgi:hypothetical protein
MEGHSIMRVKLFLLTLLLCLGLLCQPISVTSSCAATGAPPATKPPEPQAPPTATFRVTLNGFKVNHESDDDILEGDGRGDEVFITANRWMVNIDGSARPLPADPGHPLYLQTPVMGDPNGHPERIPAGTRSPGLRLDSQPGGLQTGDVFPAHASSLLTRDPLPDRLPMVLWEGQLTRGQNMVEIVPIIWEWDSPAISASEHAILDNGLLNWFELHRQTLASHIAASDLPVVGRSLATGGEGVETNDKPGTRPIGYLEERGYYGVDFYQSFTPQTVDLTYDSAMSAAYPRNASQRVLQMRYQDSNDHGDYTLFLQVFQVVGRSQVPQQVVPRRP